MAFTNTFYLASTITLKNRNVYFRLAACPVGRWGIGCQVCNCNLTVCDRVVGCKSCENPSYGGPNCNVPVNLCQTSNPCTNVAHSTCVQTQTGYQCQCATFYQPFASQCVREYRLSLSLLRSALLLYNIISCIKTVFLCKMTKTVMETVCVYSVHCTVCA